VLKRFWFWPIAICQLLFAPNSVFTTICATPSVTLRMPISGCGNTASGGLLKQSGSG
jgi:hypothetical protein